MPSRKSNVSLTYTTNEDGTTGRGTPVREREGINIEVSEPTPLFTI